MRATMSKHRVRRHTLTSSISHYCSNQTACGCSLPSCMHIYCTFCKSYTFRFSSGSPRSSLWSEWAVTTCAQFPPSTSAFQVDGKKKKNFGDCKCHVSISPVSAHTPSVIVWSDIERSIWMFVEMTRGSQGARAASRKGRHVASEARPYGVWALNAKRSHILLLSRLWKELPCWGQKAEIQVWEACLLFWVKVKGSSKPCLQPQELPDFLLKGETFFSLIITVFLCFNVLLWSWGHRD